jgi:hypothetical protein
LDSFTQWYWILSQCNSASSLLGILL